MTLITKGMGAILKGKKAKKATGQKRMMKSIRKFLNQLKNKTLLKSTQMKLKAFMTKINNENI